MIKTNLYVGSRYPVDRAKLRQLVKKKLTEHQVQNAQVDVSIVGKRKIKKLNEEHLEHQGATDVLSFPTYEQQSAKSFPQPENELPHLGEIVISFPEAVAAARRYGKKVDDQLCFYLEHGLMHLLGYHHN